MHPERKKKRPEPCRTPKKVKSNKPLWMKMPTGGWCEKKKRKNSGSKENARRNSWRHATKAKKRTSFHESWKKKEVKEEL